MGFENDIFISYAHADNDFPPLSEDKEGWVDVFKQFLNYKLKTVSDYVPKIWQDKDQLRGNVDFDSEISKIIASNAILISILSPRYLDSKWCRRELVEFLSAAEKNEGTKIGNKSRVFKVLKINLDLEKQPEEIRDYTGYEFFQQYDSGKYREFNKMYGADAVTEFMMKMDDLVLDIKEMLEELHKNKAKPQESPVEDDTKKTADEDGSDSDKIKVYLAESSFDLKDKRNDVRRELHDNGYEVLPKNEIPSHLAEDYKNEVRNIMSQCQFTVQLFSKYYGSTPEDDPKSLVEIQNEVAAEICKEKGTKRYLWIDENLKNFVPSEGDDQRQYRLIQDLKRSGDLLFGAEIFENTMKEFRVDLINKLDRLNSQINQAESSNSHEGDTGEIYIVCDRADREERTVNPLKNYLFDLGYNVTLTAFNGEEQALVADHWENLKNCDSVIIFYGNAGEPWLRAKERELKKTMGKGRTKPFVLKAVYLQDPDNFGEKEEFRSHDLKVMNGLEGKAPEEAVGDLIPKRTTE